MVQPLPWAALPVLDNSFSEEILLGAQPEHSPARLEAMPSHPVSGWTVGTRGLDLGQEGNTHLAAALYNSPRRAPE